MATQKEIKDIFIKHMSPRDAKKFLDSHEKQRRGERILPESNMHLSKEKQAISDRFDDIEREHEKKYEGNFNQELWEFCVLKAYEILRGDKLMMKTGEAINYNILTMPTDIKSLAESIYVDSKL